MMLACTIITSKTIELVQCTTGESKTVPTHISPQRTSTLVQLPAMAIFEVTSLTSNT
jgi:hypothetical protein